jgi:hypothetical protein
MRHDYTSLIVDGLTLLLVFVLLVFDFVASSTDNTDDIDTVLLLSDTCT